MQMMTDENPVTAAWEENASVEALKALSAEGQTVVMNVYGGFEQVGPIGQSLPGDDEQTTPHSGDIVLRSVNRPVVFHGSCNRAYAPLGRIVDKAPKALATMLGNGDVTVPIENFKYCEIAI